MDVSELKTRIEALVADPTRSRTKKGKAVDEVIAALDEGLLRVAEPDGESWITHAWIKHAILLYFARMDNVHDRPGLRAERCTGLPRVLADVLR